MTKNFQPVRRSPVGPANRSTVTTWAIVTGEYPPQYGGVSDYTQHLAELLARTGDRVIVYAPPCGAGNRSSTRGNPAVHRLPDHFGPRTLSVLPAELRRLPEPRRLLVQYVPQAFGARGMNVLFCRMLWGLRGFPVWTMFHEVEVEANRCDPLSHRFLAHVTHRMARRVALSSEQIFVSIPAWGRRVEAMCEGTEPIWLPIPSNIPDTGDPARADQLRAGLTGRRPGLVLGHVGTYPDAIRRLLAPILLEALREHARWALLMGRGSDAFAAELRQAEPGRSARIWSTGGLPPAQLSQSLKACDVLVQPLPDGVSTRRSTIMAGLSHGIPICTNIGALSESFWSKAGVVALAASSSPEDFRITLEMTLGDAAFRELLGGQAKRFYAENLAPLHTIAALRDGAVHPIEGFARFHEHCQARA